MKSRPLQERAARHFEKLTRSMVEGKPPTIRAQKPKSLDSMNFYRSMKVAISVLALSAFPHLANAVDFEHPSSKKPNVNLPQYVLQIEGRGQETLNILHHYPEASALLRGSRLSNRDLGPLASCIKTLIDVSSGVPSDKEAQAEMAVMTAFVTIEGVEETREWAAANKRDIRIAQAAYCVDPSKFEDVVASWDAEAKPFGKTIGSILVQYKVKQIFESLNAQTTVLSEAKKRAVEIFDVEYPEIRPSALRMSSGM